MTTKIAIIGKGNVGSALSRGFKKNARHEVTMVGNDPAAVRAAAAGADVVVLAVPFGALDATLKSLGDALDGKVVIDPTNALTADMKLALGFETSGAEELQKKAPKAKVVKAFNGVFAQHMDAGRVKDERLTLLIAGDDAAAKATVKFLGDGIGFDTIDAGPLSAARELEPLGYLNIRLGYLQKLGVEVGFRIVR
jgi:hypothetical protein